MPLALEMLARFKAPVAIVAHDAGAANHIAAWLGTSIMSEVYGSFGGPAKDIFARQCPWVTDVHFSELLPLCNTLITGTSWPSSFEHDARKLAKQAGSYSISVIDHWTNYRARFVRDGEEVLPNEIWVMDAYAKKLAESEFPDIRIIQIQNSYLEKLVREVRKHERSKIAPFEDNILYVLEPIHRAWGSSDRPEEFQALDFFITNLVALRLNSNAPIKLRLHPSETVGKYDQWIESRNMLKISLDVSSTLAEAIACADVVVGCQTYAMVVALAAGKRVISSIPSWAPSCVLPQTGILKLADLVY
jgi:hypothetical protein